MFNARRQSQFKRIQVVPVEQQVKIFRKELRHTKAVAEHSSSTTPHQNRKYKFRLPFKQSP